MSRGHEPPTVRVVPVTCAEDGYELMVTDEQMAVGRATRSGRYTGLRGHLVRVAVMVSHRVVRARAVPSALCGADAHRPAQPREFSHSVGAITCCRWRHAAAGELASRLSPRYVGFARYR